MGQNLKSRLLRLRDTGKSVPAKAPSLCFDEPGWVLTGFKTMKREFSRELPFQLPHSFAETLAILVPDIFRFGKNPSPEDLIFFDLETTGLSGGAGTIAFLAAFGRFVISPGAGNARLSINQYLLLDYPGEIDFIEKLVAEFAPAPGNNDLPVVVTYNGKSFDCQILKNRCLMNRVAFPEYFHADLLHPVRRLWKHGLPNCSQTTIEISVLGMDRTGDVSGALVPEIWFSFLRSGENRELLSVCDHNALDITGLAAIFLALADIASDPFARKYKFNAEALAISWHKALRANKLFFGDAALYQSCAKTGKTLLERAARNGGARAAIILAIDAEWRFKDFNLALAYTKLALSSSEIPADLRSKLEKRLLRLEKKCSYGIMNFCKERYYYENHRVPYKLQGK